MSFNIDLNAMLTAAGAGLLTFLFSLLKMSVTKTLKRIDSLGKQLSALDMKVSELKWIKDDFKDTLKEVTKNNLEIMVRHADLKKDVDAAHERLRKIRQGVP